jgi:phosphatidylserine decarboxylase
MNRIAPQGLPFILASAALPVLGWLLSWNWLIIPGAVGVAFFTYFFRDPERPVPEEAEAIVSPADGKVVFVDEGRESRFLQGLATRVAIFMNVFDVHVNRSPVAATVLRQSHTPGRYTAAFRRAAEAVNERQTWLLKDESGRKVLVVQIAGLLARRIIPFAREGQRLAKGERLGMICFGSRVDLYLPPESEVLVKVGDRVKAGSSVVARLWPNAA